MTGPADRIEAVQTTRRSFRDRVVGLPRRAKQYLMLSADAAGFVTCVGIAAWLNLITPVSGGDFAILVMATMVVTLAIARHLGFYHSIVRYLGIDLEVAGAKVAFGSGVLLATLAYFSNMTTTPVRLAVVFMALCVLYLVGSRFTAQHLLVRRRIATNNVIIYGAGEAGARVINAMTNSNFFSVVAVIDDDPAMHGKVLAGVPVYGRQDLGRLIRDNDVSRVLLAIPSVSRRARAEIIETLEPFGVYVQTIPDLNDIVAGNARVDELRDVGVGDLLGRDAVDPDSELMAKNVTGKSVMITGAGGSIGSELCRQIVSLKPKQMILFERSEPALYEVKKEIKSLCKQYGCGCNLVAILGSVENHAHLRETMLSFGIDTLYHAAAYKHVPMVERNMLAGVENNVFGTLATAQAAIEARVGTFVLVSTDKAVSPPNIMGATKRFAELVLQAMQEEHPEVRFCMVRFGNVLESSGSVVPLFREQIQVGGPVTVTHPEIIRYFMTIPEAAQLVIQAGAMAQGGDVFVLDMGKPVKIVDLARRMIQLSGLTVRDDDNPDGDIEIHYTGLRPAEKLYEELLIGDNATGTRHPRILRASESYLPWHQLTVLLSELASRTEERDRHGAREILKRVVDGYRPTNGIDDLLWKRATTEGEIGRGINVVPIKPKAS